MSEIEGRPGFPGAPRALGGEGGHIGAPLAEYLPAQRWFAGKTRRIRGTVVLDRIAVGPGTLYIVGVSFEDAPVGVAERYLLALLGTEPAMDAFDEPAFCRALLDVVRRGAEVPGDRGRLFGRPSRAFVVGLADDAPARRLRGEQSNTSVVFGDRLIMKHFRRLTAGVNPDLELARFLTEHTTFRGTPRLAGALEYHAGEPITLAVANELVRGARDGWQWLLDRLRGGDFALPALRRLGERTAELHLALATPTAESAFGVAPITAGDVAGWSDAVRRQVAAARAVAGRPLPDVGDVADALGALVGRAKIRHHGDFHLGQTLAVDDGREFMIIDFEGEPLRPLSERRRKHTPLRDVAGMLRSFGYAAASVGLAAPDRARWEPQARATFLAGYRARAADAPFVPASEEVLARVVAALEVEKAAYEIVYEASHRPDWLEIPLGGFLSAAAALGRPAGAA